MPRLSTEYKVFAASHQNSLHAWLDEKKSPSIFCLCWNKSRWCSYLFNVVNISIKLFVDLAQFLFLTQFL